MTKQTFDISVLDFLERLEFKQKLPPDISVMNPYKNASVMEIVRKFYHKFYCDHYVRHLILGINPGRLGAGATGIPFTDTKRLESHCKIHFDGFRTHEPSSVFVYEMIDASGGPEKFYQKFYISSVCPLGFTSSMNGKPINYNYYDSALLRNAVKPFVIDMLNAQLNFGISRQTCYVLGTGKNYQFVEELNSTHHFFAKVVPLEHPRYIMQYKSGKASEYIDKYLSAFAELA